MKQITLHKQWIIDAPVAAVFGIMTDFERMPAHFPKVAESINVVHREGNRLEMDAIVKSFGKRYRVRMKTEILPGKGFVSDNDSYEFGTSGHEELVLAEHGSGTMIDYTYQVSVYKKLLRIFALPLLRIYAMRFWEKAVIDRLKEILKKPIAPTCSIQK